MPIRRAQFSFGAMWTGESAFVVGLASVSRLRRGTYLTAVTGYPAAAAAGEALVTSRLSADAERVNVRRDEG